MCLSQGQDYMYVHNELKTQRPPGGAAKPLEKGTRGY